MQPRSHKGLVKTSLYLTFPIHVSPTDPSVQTQIRLHYETFKMATVDGKRERDRATEEEIVYTRSCQLSTQVSFAAISCLCNVAIFMYGCYLTSGKM